MILVAILSPCSSLLEHVTDYAPANQGARHSGDESEFNLTRILGFIRRPSTDSSYHHHLDRRHIASKQPCSFLKFD